MAMAIVERLDECSLILQFTLAPTGGLEIFNITEYMVGVCKMVKRLLNNYGIENSLPTIQTYTQLIGLLAKLLFVSLDVPCI